VHPLVEYNHNVYNAVASGRGMQSAVHVLVHTVELIKQQKQILSSHCPALLSISICISVGLILNLKSATQLKMRLARKQATKT